jgi:hypothetical protein
VRHFVSAGIHHSRPAVTQAAAASAANEISSNRVSRFAYIADWGLKGIFPLPPNFGIVKPSMVRTTTRCGPQQCNVQAFHIGAPLANQAPTQNVLGRNHRGRLFKNRQLSGAHFPFNQYRNSQKETERPAQYQQYEQVAIRLRGNREPCDVGHEKAEKT